MIFQERLNEIKELKLHRGMGAELENACFMQIIAYVAGEELTDRPNCACPVLTEYCIRLSLKFNDKDRQKLRPFIPMIIGTRLTDETQIARKRLIMWRNVTAIYPMLLDLINQNKYADKLRTVPNTIAGMIEAKEFLTQTRDELQKIAYVSTYHGKPETKEAIFAFDNTYSIAYKSVCASVDAYLATPSANPKQTSYEFATSISSSYLYAYAYTSAKKIRASIVDLDLETLRLALEIKSI